MGNVEKIPAAVRRFRFHIKHVCGCWARAGFTELAIYGMELSVSIAAEYFEQVLAEARRHKKKRSDAELHALAQTREFLKGYRSGVFTEKRRA
jgi:hypothetical protein